MVWTRRWANVVDPDRTVPILNVIATTANLALVLLASVALCTGIVTTAGIFYGKHIFNGLAHLIKGGVFVYGLITFARWIGCFAYIRLSAECQTLQFSQLEKFDNDGRD